VFKLLYIRSVYWFNLKTGGSVGHTAGVVNSLNKKIKLDVYSNDKLPSVAAPVNIIKPIKIPFLPNDICELLYSLKLIILFRKLTDYNAIYQRYSGFSFASSYLSKRHKIPLIL